jgi:hypothetical protein
VGRAKFVPEVRQLTALERDVLGAPLSVDFPGVEGLRAQAREVSVVGVCDCGCPTIYFTPKPPDQDRLAVEAVVPGSSEGVLLFVTDSGLDAMESTFAREPPPDRFPDARDLEIVVR